MFERLITKICRSSLQRPWFWIAASITLSIPALLEVSQKLKIDTGLTRLLPENSRPVRWGKELKPVVGYGEYLSVLFEGGDQATLKQVQARTAARIAKMPEILNVNYQYPVDFIKRFGLLLAQSDILQNIFDVLLEWKLKASPFALNLDEKKQELPGSAKEGDLRAALQLYSNLPDVHQSADGRTFGILVHPKKGLDNLSASAILIESLEKIASEEAEPHGLWYGVGGSLRNAVDVYKRIRSDLAVSGSISLFGIIFILILTFRSLRLLPILLYPLGIALTLTGAAIPIMVGELNTITSFLIMILLGMGVEYSIHLVKRFQLELLHHALPEALMETFTSTGASIFTSALTTAAGLIVLAFSSFRGFSDFGVISGVSMLIMATSVLLLLPATLVLGHQHKLLKASMIKAASSAWIPNAWLTAGMAACVLVACSLAFYKLSFDYDFKELQNKSPNERLVWEKLLQVYPASLTPAAIYVAKDFEALDSALETLQKAKNTDYESPTIGRLSSIREFVPDPAEEAKRKAILKELQDRLQGRWIRRVEDPQQRQWIETVRDFPIPEHNLTLEEVPSSLVQGLIARDGSGEFVLGVYPSVERKYGKNAIAFTQDLAGVQMPEGVRGPTGETPIMGEILQMVTKEGPWLVACTFLCIILLVLWDCHGSLAATFWILLPLTAGFILTLGSMVALGWQLNFFNMIVLPNLIGMSVDSGVHMYHRWKDLKSIDAAQRELFNPLTSSTFATIAGYFGLLFANHQGLRAIADLALLGLICCWAATVFFMSGILRILEGRAQRQPTSSISTHYQPISEAV